MEVYPESLEFLIGQLSKLPSIGKKSAERLAIHIATSYSKEDIDLLIKSLNDVENKLGPCKICGNLTEEGICYICRDPKRDDSIICVVEGAKDLYALEKAREYLGVYHVLGGLISPQNDVDPDSINLDSLLQRADEEKTKEIILAFSSTVEGEITGLFLQELLKDKKPKLTKIASGIPMGGSLEYYDSETLFKAMEDRKEL